MDALSTRRCHGHPVRNLLVVLAISLLTLAVFLGIAEAWFRYTVPFTATDWPGRFDPQIGTLFKPGAVLQWTNGIDFWTRTRANSLGFLDREPPAGPEHNGCRVLFIGDSFVEAAQVPIARKFHVLFEHLASEQLPELDIETLAFGYSGTGQANQLAYYESLGAPLHPDVVVLVFAGNDFADNSPLLESARNGWHPRHLPRLFFSFAPDDEHIERLPIDPDWMQYQLPHANVAWRPLHAFLQKHSYFYNWLFTHLRAHLPAVAALLSRRSKSGSVMMNRYDIEKIDGFSAAFAGWNYPDDLSMDVMFDVEGPLPPVFEQALRLTGHALDEFQQRARSDGFRLLVLAGIGLSPRFEAGTVNRGRPMQDRAPLHRLAALTVARGIPLIDHYDYLIAQGGTKADAHFSRDYHWSEQGHAWAAGAMLEYFRHNPQVCSPNGEH